MDYNLIIAKYADLSMLYNTSAFTFEGLTTDKDSMNQLFEVFKPFIKDNIKYLDIYIVKGSLMNRHYCLKYDPYPDNLNIVAIPTNQFKDLGKLAMFKLQVGARWFDDIVDNNNIHESASM